MAEVKPGDDLFVEAVVQQELGVKYDVYFSLNGVQQGVDILLKDTDGKVWTYEFGKYCDKSKGWCSILIKDEKPEGTVNGTDAEEVEEETGVVEIKIVRCDAVPAVASDVHTFTFGESKASNVKSEGGDKKKDDLYACKGGRMHTHGMSSERVTRRYETTAHAKLYFGSDFLCTTQKFKVSGVASKDRIGPNSMEKRRRQQASSSSVSKCQKTVLEPKKELPKPKAQAEFVDLTGSDGEDTEEDTSKDSKAEIVD